MSSQKSSAPLLARSSEGVAPTRARGRLRVAAILDAGAAVIAEKGYDAATMSEIAARSATAIGSLYRFFPTKEALTDALLQRFIIDIESALAQIAAHAPKLGATGVVDALVELMLDRRDYRTAAIALVDVKRDGLARREAVRTAMRGGIAAILRAAAPTMNAGRASLVAPVVLQMLKAARPLDDGSRYAKKRIGELRVAISLYVATLINSPP